MSHFLCSSFILFSKDIMKKKVVLHIAKTLYKKLNKARKLALEECDPENIHSLRISYKKLKAFLLMLNTKHHKQPVVTKKLKKVYKLSGNIRDSQLQLLRYQEADKTKEIEQYTKILHQNIEQFKQEILKLLSKKITTKWGQKGLAAIHQKFGAKDFTKYLKTKQRHIQKMASQKYVSDTSLHAIRKELKELSYNSKYLVDKAFNISNQQKKQYAFYDKLSVTLGDFQDLCNAIYMLQPDSHPFLKTLKRRWLAQEQKNLLNKKAAIKKTLIQDIKTMFP